MKQKEQNKAAAADANEPQYAIGIDLGTTNSVLACAKLGEDNPTVELLPIPQVVAAGPGIVTYPDLRLTAPRGWVAR